MSRKQDLAQALITVSGDGVICAHSRESLTFIDDNHKNMKYLVALLLLLSINVGQTQSALTYEEGLANCNQMREALLKEDPTLFPYIPPECIQGATIPSFESKSMEDKVITNQMLVGKISILNFWFMACPPCVAEIPGFNAIVDKYGADQINFIAIGRDTKADILDFLEENPWKFQILPNNEYMIDETFKIRWGYPTTFLLNQNAEIVFAFSGGKTDERAALEIQQQLIPIIDQMLK